MSTKPTFITGTAIALVSKYRDFDPANPSATSANEFTFVNPGLYNSVAWAADGYTEVGTVELTVKVSPREEITRNMVCALRKQQQNVRAEAEQSAPTHRRPDSAAAGDYQRSRVRSMDNVVAVQRHAEHMLAIKHQMARLNGLVNSRLGLLDTERLNWGHVGDAAYVREQLDQLLSFLGGSGAK